MKLTIVLSLLALFGSLSVSAQEVPTITPVPTVEVGNCWMFEKEIYIEMAFTQSQCERISAILMEDQQILMDLYNKLNPLKNEENNLNHSGQVPRDRLAAKRLLGDLKDKIWDIEYEVQVIVSKQRRLVRGVLDERQVQIANNLQKITPTVRLYGQASGLLIDGYQTMYPQPSVWMQNVQQPRQ